MYKYYILITFLVLIVGCQNIVPDSQTINLRNNTDKLSLSKQEKFNAAFKVDNVVDERFNKSNIGVLFGKTEIYAENLIPWLKESFVALENNGNQNNADPIHLNFKIKQLYLNQANAAITATIVVDVDGKKGNDTIFSKSYRKPYSKMLWKASDRELIAIMNDALISTRTAIVNDLKNI